MPDNENELPLDKILSILENPIRRKILQKLSRDANYPLQLSRELGVSQQAVMKHLRVLEDSDFVVSYEERSDKGGPPRRVYIPRKRYCIRIDIGPNTYSEDFYSYMEYELKKLPKGRTGPLPLTQVEIKGKVTGEMKEEVAGTLPAFTDPKLEEFRMKLETIVNMGSKEEKLRSIRELVSSLNNEIEKHESKRRNLLTLRERVYKEANRSIVETADDNLEREILSLFVKDEISDLDIIADILDKRKIYIEEKFKEMIKKTGM
ncbi:MAG: helix-turn-helix domain-containing protein [Thermoplasmatota archaeon]